MSRDDQAGGRADTIVPGKVCAMRGMSYRAKNIIRDAIRLRTDVSVKTQERRTLVGGLTTAVTKQRYLLILYGIHRPNARRRDGSPPESEGRKNGRRGIFSCGRGLFCLGSKWGSIDRRLIHPGNLVSRSGIWGTTTRITEIPSDGDFLFSHHNVFDDIKHNCVAD